MKSYQNKPSFQGASGIYGGLGSKDRDSKASVEMYRTRQLPIGLGLASINPRLIHMNSWLKLRKIDAAKKGVVISIMRIRSKTKKAQASGECGEKSHFSLGQRMLGVKRGPTGLVLRSGYGTLETIFSQFEICEMMIEIGSKRMPWVMPRIDHLVNPRGCRLPMTLLLDKFELVICP